VCRECQLRAAKAHIGPQSKGGRSFEIQHRRVAAADQLLTMLKLGARWEAIYRRMLHEANLASGWPRLAAAPGEDIARGITEASPRRRLAMEMCRLAPGSAHATENRPTLTTDERACDTYHAGPRRYVHG
jgi:hypothetical protein